MAAPIALSAILLASPARAANYTAANEAELRQAIIDANADGDPASTITLTGNVVLGGTTSLGTVTKALTIDTNGFSLVGLQGTGITGTGGAAANLGGGPVTIDGTLTGGAAATADSRGAGGIGLSQNGGAVTNNGTIVGGMGGSTSYFSAAGRRSGLGGVGLSANGTAIINEVSAAIVGGAGGNYDAQGQIGGGTNAFPTLGGTGIALNGGSLDNRGSITGGTSGMGSNFPLMGDNIFSQPGGTGAILNGGVHTNSGTITGGAGGTGYNQGASGHGVGGDGLNLVGGAVLVNNAGATIAGGNGRAGGGTTLGTGSNGGLGAVVQNARLENFGTITGGNSGATTGALGGGTGIVGYGQANIINGGILTSGVNGNGTRANAVQFINGNNRLELQAGFSITGNVLATATDTLALGGSTNGTFDVSVIGDAAQYRGFGRYEKTGTSTWTLTGTTAAMTPWTLLGGILQISADSNLGAPAGGITFNGGTLETATSIATSRSMTFAGTGTFLVDPGTTLTLNSAVGGAGTLGKDGAGTLILTADSIFSGGIQIADGILQLGTGGTSGWIEGNTVNNGNLVFNRSDAVSFDSAISGTGNLSQVGTGVLTLTGANSYAGTTTVASGTLLVNGNQAAATGDTTVNGGAKLGGTGVVGGNLEVANGGELAPGGLGSVPGTLTVNGNMMLNSGATLTYDFGQAGVVGGALNDLTTVGSNLTLDGTIDVMMSAGGSFDPGIYRVISYGGILTNNTLDIGVVPTPTYFVQTSIGGQVNLVNTAGTMLRFWDGDIRSAIPLGGRNDSIIQGGDGVWQDLNGNDNWTISDGTPNAPFTDSAFAVFGGEAGLVTVDDTLGAINVAGMQFATDGYRIEGDDLNLVGPQSIIRVGDGTAGGAGYVATIASNMNGTTQLVKTDLGTLVLSGTNTYTGGTAINGGTLRIADDANLGDAAGGLSFDGGTLNTTADLTTGRDISLIGAGTFLTDIGTAATLTGQITGTGTLTKAGAGTLVIASDALYTGGTVIGAGTLQVGDGATSGSILGDVANNGILAFSRSDTIVFNGLVSGTGQLVQTGAGTTVLLADNSYSGGTTITSGMLQLGDGGTVGSVVGDVTNNGALAFNHSDTVTFGGVISGSGSVSQLGSGRTVLAGSNTYAGATAVDKGVLAAGGVNTFSAASAHAIAAGSALDLAGFDQTIGGLDNAGVVIMGSAGTSPSTTLTLAGNYVGSGGTLVLNTNFGTDNSATDIIIVAGDTSGITDVSVVNAGGPGAQTAQGIKIIDVAGASNGIFSLLGDYLFQGEQAMVVGAYGYRLQKNGIATPADGDWYLRSTLLLPDGEVSPLYQPGAPVYETYAAVLQGFNGLDTLQQRVGNRSWTNGVVDTGVLPEAAGAGSGIWGRIVGRHASIDPRASTTGADYDSDTWQLQAGADGQLYAGDAGNLIGGLSVRYGTIAADVSSIFGDGSISSIGYGLGGTLTWYGSSGFYLDAQANLTWYDSDLSSSTAATSLVSDNDGFGYALGLEAGQQIALGPNWSVTPQAQLLYSAVDYDDFTDAFGATVSLADADRLKIRLGISADYQNSWTDEAGQTSRLHAYGIANLYYDILPKTATDLAGVRLISEQEALWGGIGLGGTYNWGNDKYAIHGEAAVNTSLTNFGDSYDVTGTAGFTVRF